MSTLGIANISMAAGDCAFAVGGSFTDLNIESAVTNAANAHTNLGHHSDTIKDLSFFGSWDMIIKKSSTRSNLINDSNNIKEESNSNSLKVKENIPFTRDNQNIDLIVEKMKQLYLDFDINDFEVKIHKLSDTEDQFIIDFDYKIGEFYTNEGYVVSIRDGKMYEITNNMSYIQKYNAQQKNINKVDNYKEKAVIEDATQTLMKKKSELGNIEILSQKVKYSINRSENIKSVEILTEYKLDDGSMGGTVYKKDL